MPIDKPARLITKLTAQIVELNREIKAANARGEQSDHYLSELTKWQAAATENRDVITRMERDQLALELQRDSLELQRDSLAEATRGQAAIVESLQIGAAQDASTIAGLEQAILDLRQRDEILEQREAELRVLAAKVEERGRKREAQDAQAILNRRAVVGTLPGR